MKKLKKIIQWEKIEVFWVDSMQSPGWKSLKKHEEDIVDEALKHKSCGYFYKFTKQSLCLMQSVSDYDELGEANAADLLQIPIAAISKIKEL